MNVACLPVVWEIFLDRCNIYVHLLRKGLAMDQSLIGSKSSLVNQWVFVGVTKRSMGVDHLWEHELKHHHHWRAHLNMGDVSWGCIPGSFCTDLQAALQIGDMPLHNCTGQFSSSAAGYCFFKAGERPARVLQVSAFLDMWPSQSHKPFLPFWREFRLRAKCCTILWMKTGGMLWSYVCYRQWNYPTQNICCCCALQMPAVELQSVGLCAWFESFLLYYTLPSTLEWECLSSAIR